MFKVAWYVSFFLLKNLALFASAVVSAADRGPRAYGKERLACSSPWP